MATRTRTMSPTPLAIFVRERLAELEIRQSDFCRLSMFDQGLLSKIQNSVVSSLSLESVLKLAVGLSVPPQRIFNLLDRMDMHDLVIKSYASEFSEMVTDNLRDRGAGDRRPAAGGAQGGRRQTVAGERQNSPPPLASRSTRQIPDRRGDGGVIKQASLNLLRVSGAFDLMRLAHRRHAVILMYHRFSSGGEGANVWPSWGIRRPPKSSPSSWSI